MLFVYIAIFLSRLCPTNSYLSDFQIGLFNSRNLLNFAWHISPCARAWKISLGSEIGQSQRSPHFSLPLRSHYFCGLKTWYIMSRFFIVSDQEWINLVPDSLFWWKWKTGTLLLLQLLKNLIDLNVLIKTEVTLFFYCFIQFRLL